jgi:hypothetical protein
MFVGDNLNAYGKWLLNGGRWGDPGNHTMTYWRRALSLLDVASVPTSEVFFTNAYVGLIVGDNPSADFPGRKDPSFSRWCAAFLEEQIHVMQPCLVVALGGASQRALASWDVAGLARAGKILELSHPSNRKGKAAMLDDAATLRQAYALVMAQTEILPV